MKDNKDKKIEVRLTEKEKEQLKAYAEKHHMTMSEVVRVFCEKIFQEDDK